MKKLIGALWILAIALVATFFLSSGPSETQEFKLAYKDTAVAPATPVVVLAKAPAAVIAPAAKQSEAKESLPVAAGLIASTPSSDSKLTTSSQVNGSPSTAQSPSQKDASAASTSLVSTDQGIVTAADASEGRVARAASSIHMDIDAFKHIATNDHDLKIDGVDRPFYTCSGLIPADLTIPTGPASSTFTNPPFAVDSTTAFQLHSRPGAPYVIYLDFNGHTTTYAGWNGGVAFTTPAFQLSDTAVWNDKRNLDAILNLWSHVSEDYSAWDVDVTTEQPALTARGQRAVIGGSVSQWLKVTGVAGVAHLNSFSNVLDGNDNPCYIFSADGYSSTSYAYLNQCISHELGHTLSLNHWGEVAYTVGTKTTPAAAYSKGHAVTGHTGISTTGPIMGGGAICSLMQWSKGDYPYATCTVPTQNDIAFISTYLSHLTRIDSLSTATSLGNANVISFDGAIADSTDVNLIKIRAAPGTLKVGGLVAYYRPDLKLGLSLLDSTGTVVAKNYTTTTMANSLTYVVPTAGYYYIKVNGLGYDSAASASAQVWTNSGITGTVVGTSAAFTNYGSIGRYSLAGTWTAVANSAPVANITSDANGGLAPITIGFSGTGSSDADGIVSSYAWTFGDTLSTSNTSTLANPSHTYIAPGTYTVTLRVTDNAGASSLVTSKIITTTGVLPAEVKIASITPVWTVANSYQGVLSADIALVDQYGQPLRNVLVYVTVSGFVNGKASAKSDTSGHVYISCPKIANTASGTVTFTVTSLVLKGYPWLTTHDTGNPCVLTR